MCRRRPVQSLAPKSHATAETPGSAPPELYFILTRVFRPVVTGNRFFIQIAGLGVDDVVGVIRIKGERIVCSCGILAINTATHRWHVMPSFTVASCAYTAAGNINAGNNQPCRVRIARVLRNELLIKVNIFCRLFYILNSIAVSYPFLKWKPTIKKHKINISLTNEV